GRGRRVEEVVHDDGADRHILLAIEGTLNGSAALPRTEVSAEKFAMMRWPVEAWGTKAVVLAGAGTADHVRAALQLLSGDVRRRTVYAHTGWLKVGGRRRHLHAGGATRADGPARDIGGAPPSPAVAPPLP